MGAISMWVALVSFKALHNGVLSLVAGVVAFVPLVTIVESKASGGTRVVEVVGVVAVLGLVLVEKSGVDPLSPM